MTTPRSNFIGIYVSGTRVRAALIDDQGSIIEGKLGEIAPKTMIPQLAAIVDEHTQRYKRPEDE